MGDYGMFIHYGPNTFKQCAWGDGQFKPEDFNPSNLEENASKWVEFAQENKFDYIVLITKHHDGFCMWDTAHTDYKITKSRCNLDLVKTVSEECRKRNIKLGLYYSLWDLNFADYNDDDIYYEYMKNQITELLTNYGDVLELWFDGAWDKDYPGGSDVFDPNWENNNAEGYYLGDRWKWKELYELIHTLQPECKVINNSGFDRPGEIKYLPIDVRTSERMNFVIDQKIKNADPLHDIMYKGEKIFAPLEYVNTLNPDWFFTGGTRYIQPDAATVFNWYLKAKRENNNLLLNVGPDKDGKIIDCEREVLRDVVLLIDKEEL